MYKDIDYKLNTENQDIILSTDVEAITNSIRNIVTIGKNTIPGRPDFGVELEGLLFEPNDELSYILAEEIILEEIEEREPRVITEDINITPDVNNNRVIIAISIRILKSDELANITIKINN